MDTKKGFKATDEDDEDAEVAYNLVQRKAIVEQAERNYHDAIIRAKDESGWTFKEIGEVLGIAGSWVYKLYHRRKYATGGRKAYPKGPPRSVS
jgi:hypothetical protein